MHMQKRGLKAPLSQRSRLNQQALPLISYLWLHSAMIISCTASQIQTATDPTQHPPGKLRIGIQTLQG